jgi:hypothetical protein
MKRDLGTLREVGEALYGLAWQSPLSRDLKVADRTVRRWLAGDFPVPDGVWPEIAAICAKRGDTLAKWADRLG